jgi:2-amino-4-hydroxy-6-hydroxymethyldihydropteridine diphosphokinase
LLSRTQEIERAMGRKRTVSKGPRVIDVDILLFASAMVRAADLEIPHPRLGERRFVLEPLAELAPDLRHPVSRRTVREMLADVTDQRVIRR